MSDELEQRVQALELALGIDPGLLVVPLQEKISKTVNTSVDEANSVTVIFEKTHPDAVVPDMAYSGDACFDLIAVEDTIIPPAIMKYTTMNETNSLKPLINAIAGWFVSFCGPIAAQNITSGQISYMIVDSDPSDDTVDGIEYKGVSLGKNFVPVGLKMQIPMGWEATFRSRSSFGVKQAMRVHPGTIDAGYRGELSVAVYNMGSEPVLIKKGQGVAQVAVRPVPKVKVVEGTVDNDSERGSKGFGSSDKV